MTNRRGFFGVAAGAIAAAALPASPASQFQDFRFIAVMPHNEYTALLTEAVRLSEGFSEKFLKETLVIMNATAKGGTI